MEMVDILKRGSMYIYYTTNNLDGKVYVGKSEREINENYLGSGI